VLAMRYDLIVGSSTKLLSEYIRAVREGQRGRKLWVFDFDDTLVKTDANTHVTNGDRKFDLSPAEYAVYDKQPGDQFDFTDFERLINPRAVKWVNRILHNVYQHHGPEAIVVLSARSYQEPIMQYLKSIGLDDVEIVALNTAVPAAKAAWVDARIKRDKLSTVEFFDDSPRNVTAIAALRQQHPGVMIVSRHIIHNRVASLVSPQ
jgi:hypothetical protein